MKQRLLLACLAWALLCGCVSGPASSAQKDPKIYVAVIGGLTRSGLWPELARRFEAASAYQVILVDSGNREIVADLFRAGELDLALIHGGETASNLVAQGFAAKVHPWAQNDFVFIGPSSDPAHIRGLRDGAEALRRIATSEARLARYQNSGPRDVIETLLAKSQLEPSEKWMLDTSSGSSEEAVEFARQNRAYVVLGRVPKIPDGLEILAQGDPTMQRPFVILEASVKRFSKANVRGMRALSEFLRSKETRAFMRDFAKRAPEGVPIFLPAGS